MLLRKIAAFFGLKPKVTSIETSAVELQPIPNLTFSEQINLDYLREMAMGDEDFVMEIIRMFIEQTPANLHKLQEFVHNQQWREVKELTHKMKSSMVMIGSTELEDIFQEVQLYAVNPSKTVLIQPMVLRAKHLCEFAIKDLKAELQALESQPDLVS